MVDIIRCKQTANKIFASSKHEIILWRSTSFYLLSGPFVAHVNCCQIAAIIEHRVHSCYIRSIEAAQVKARQGLASRKHVRHICYLGSIEIAQVKARQTFAVFEHAVHIGYI